MAASELVGDPALGELLDEELCYDATTTTRLSNHLPMALVALHRLGASDDRLAEFAAQYRGRLASIPDTVPVASYDEWLAARGKRDAYGALRGYFDAQIAEGGPESTLRRHLPALVDGLGGAAFHGLIRLAYAVEVASDARIAAGLAYLSEVHQPLGERGRSIAWTADPLVALRRLSDVAVLREMARTGNIGQRMRQVAAHPTFSGVVDWLEVDESTPRRLCAAAVALYSTTDDFTALHAVTASHAALVVTPFVEDRGALCAYWFQAMAAAYLSIGAPRLTEPGRPLEPWLAAPVSWERIASAATTSDDEHVSKLVYSARELERVDASPLLRAVAARQAGIAPEG